MAFVLVFIFLGFLQVTHTHISMNPPREHCLSGCVVTMGAGVS